MINNSTTYYYIIVSMLNMLVLIGLMIFSVGLIRNKNAQALLIKQLASMATATITFVCFGYALMLANNSNPYYPNFAAIITFHGIWKDSLHHIIKHTNLAPILFHCTVINIALSILIGATAERLKLSASILFSVFFAGIIYPIVSYWNLPGGYLHLMGFIDYAGASSVYLTAATAALISNVLLGPRIGKHRPNHKIIPIPGDNLFFSCLGGMLFVIGTIGFNSSYLAVLPNDLNSQTILFITLNILVAAGTGILTAMLITRIFFRKIDLSMVLNGMMVSIVSISASSSSTCFAITIIISIITCIVVLFAIVLFDKLRLDDPIGGVGVFGLGAVLSLISVSYTEIYHQTPTDNFVAWGLIKQFGIQFHGIATIFLWSIITSLIFLLMIRIFVGIRIDRRTEIYGEDWDTL